jgi:intracellular sulfur oxidation DsrE/DsrF family protein
MEQFDRRGMFGVGALLAGAGFAAGSPGLAQAAPAGAAAREAIDAWMDRPARHRLLLDTTTAGAAGAATDYAMNFIHANETGYGLKPQDLAVIIVLRHMSTPYAYGDATWRKHGKSFAKMLKLEGEEAIQAVSGNPLLANPEGSPPKGFEWSFGPPLTLLAQKGAMFAVCALATQGIAQQLAKGGGNAAAIETALKADLVANAHMVPAGIVAVGHAQERGYPFAYIA